MANKHFPCLNGFRAIALGAIVFHHLVHFFGIFNWLTPAWQRLAFLGSLGVDCFFVLSGFLITGLLLEDIVSTGKIRIVRFYLRRSFKIIPHYILVILIAIGLAPSILKSASLPFYFCFLQNYVPPVKPLAHLWSIAVEEHFYLLLPLVITGCVKAYRNNTIRGLTVTFILLIIIGNWLRFVAWKEPVSEAQASLMASMTHLRFDALIFGCLLRVLFERPRIALILAEPMVRLGFFCTGAALYGWFFKYSFTPGCWWHYTLGYLAPGCALLAALGGFPPLKALTEWKVMDQIGRASYGIYLWHYILLIPFLTLYYGAGTKHPGIIAAYILASCGAGILSTATVEKYFLRVREKLVP